jgi:DNA polymerase III subunit alpha
LSQFVHLSLRSEYSLVDSILRIKPLITACKEQGMPAVALTDQTNLFAAVKFYKAARAEGVKPIIGSDFLLDLGDGYTASMSLLAMDERGYKNIIELISRAYLQGQATGKTLVQRSWLEELSESVICLSGATGGEIGQWLTKGKEEQASSCLESWMQLYPGRFYLELQRTGRPDENEYIEAVVEMASEKDCPLVATNNVRFLTEEEFEAHEARVCIHDGESLTNPNRARKYSEKQYLRSPREMVELFSDIPEAIENTLRIAQRCNVELGLGSYFLPEYPIPEGMTEAEFFRKVSHEGLEKRLDIILDKAAPEYEERRQVYIDRLNFELDIIIQMGFPGYFLIVMDFIQWAKEQQIPVGPGRGSGAGSVVAYSLLITDLDPLEYDLLFERFLNPERVSMPDFDIDFCMDNRDRVIEYVADTYGRMAVSQIVTFGTMAAKAVIRDVARVQGKSYGLADRLSKMIPFEVGMTLQKAFEQEEQIRKFLEEDGEAQEIWDMAVQLEGISRNCGKHAGGVVIAPTKLTDFAPLYCDERGEGLVTQYDKDDVESVGLVKFDFLGLRTLTIIDWAVKMVNLRREKEALQPINIDRIDLEDTTTFEMLQRAETTAVFQLESRGMKDLIRRQLPSCFEDIIALVALFRPGPLQSGMVDDFINRKHGREQVAYPHPKYQHEELKPVLEPTYGIILYQEQVMQIAQIIGNYTLGGADLLRRAMGKKKAEEMAKQREIFMEGAQGRGIDADLASNLFDLMEKFAGYGFNKSHSAAYALVAYQTAWLKAHYPAEFMAAVMSADMQNTDKIVTFVDECNSMGLNLTPPDVNAGQLGFSVNDVGDIVYGLGAIKGLGDGAIESIIENRKNDGPYKDLFDFCSRVDLRKVNKRSLEALVLAGAIDAIGPKSETKGSSRAQLLALLPEAIKTAEQNAQNLSAGIEDLFGDAGAEKQNAGSCYQSPVEFFPWSNREVLQKEKDTIGLFLTGHPLDDYADEIYALSNHKISSLKASRSKQWLGGLIIGIRTIKTKRGDNMAIVSLDDRSGRIDVTLFADAFEQCRQFLVKDAMILVEGQVEHDDYNGSLRVRGEKVVTLYDMRRKCAQGLAINIDGLAMEPATIDQLRDAVMPYIGGNCPLQVRYRLNGYGGELSLGDQWNVEPSDELIHKLKQLLGSDSVSLTF